MRNDAILLSNHGVRAGQAASILNTQHGTRIQPNDIHRIKSLKRQIDKGDTISIQEPECQRLLKTITNYGDYYRVKVNENNREMECIFYWDPQDVQLARRFCQVSDFLLICMLTSISR